MRAEETEAVNDEPSEWYAIEIDSQKKIKEMEKAIMKAKKILSTLLAILMLFAIIPMNVAAQTDDLTGGSRPVENPEIKVVDIFQPAFMEHVGNGEFRMIDYLSRTQIDAHLISNDFAASAQIGDIIMVTPVSDEILEGFYHVGQNRYLVQVTDTAYLLMDKIEVDTESFQNNSAVFAMRGVSEERIAELESDIREQRELGNKDFSVELYSPAFLDIIGVSPLWVNEGRTAYYTFTCHVGHRWTLFDQFWARRNFREPTRQVGQGTNARGVAAGFTSMGASIAGVVVPTIGMFGTVAGVVQSALDIYVAAGGRHTFVATGNDFMEYNFTYDRVLKETFIRRDNLPQHGFRPGAVTGRVWVNGVYLRQFFANGGLGRTLDTRHFINRTFETPRFARPENLAIQGFDAGLMWGWTVGPAHDTDVTITIHGNNHRFRTLRN